MAATRVNVDQLHIKTYAIAKDLNVDDVLTYDRGNVFIGIADYPKVPNFQYLYEHISLPCDWISCRQKRSGNLSYIDYSITRSHPIGLFNSKKFQYKIPPNNNTTYINQIYCINNTYTLYQFEIFHRVYGRNLIPDVGQKFNESAKIAIYIHIDDKTSEPQILNEGVLFDGTLMTYNEKSSASFVRELRENDRLRIIHSLKLEIQTEILIKVSAIR